MGRRRVFSGVAVAAGTAKPDEPARAGGAPRLADENADQRIGSPKRLLRHRALRRRPRPAAIFRAGIATKALKTTPLGADHPSRLNSYQGAQ